MQTRGGTIATNMVGSMRITTLRAVIAVSTVLSCDCFPCRKRERVLMTRRYNQDNSVLGTGERHVLGVDTRYFGEADFISLGPLARWGNCGVAKGDFELYNMSEWVSEDEELRLAMTRTSPISLRGTPSLLPKTSSSAENIFLRPS